MKKLLPIVLLAAGCASSSDSGALVGRVRFVDTNGQPAGEASLYQAAEGIRVVGTLPNIPAGTHGFHVHAVGECTAPSFDSAGPHFNPAQREHGRLNPNGPHAGDLPNVNGPALNILVEGLQMIGPTGVLDANGAALVLHANADDERTDPSGNSGARIRCGVIERS